MAKGKDVLHAALRALIEGAETSPWVKIPAAFIAELAALSKEDRKELESVSGESFRELLTQMELSTANAALAAAGAEQIKSLIFRMARLSTNQLKALTKLTQDRYEYVLNELHAIHADTEEIKAGVKELSKKVESIRTTLGNNNSETESKRSVKKGGEDEDKEKGFDVFLSHSHVDEDVVKQIGVKLEDNEGFKVWLDKWILVPGDRWQQEMAKGIDRSRTCAICIGKNTPTGWFREEIERSLNRQVKDVSFRVIPVILPGGDESVVDNFLELRTWVRFKNGIDDAEALYRLSCGIKGISPHRRPNQNDGFESSIEIARKDLMLIRSFRDVIDDEIAYEYQRKVLDKIFKL